MLQRRLGLPVKLFDPRFVAHRQRFELCEDAASKLGTWWKYCQFNGAEPRLVSLLDRTTHSYAATATLWEMEGFSFRWNTPTVGVVDWFVRPDLRGQGVGKYLLAQLLRSAQESLLEIMEMQVPEDNGAALKLCKFAGFEQVDEGRLYERVGD